MYCQDTLRLRSVYSAIVLDERVLSLRLSLKSTASESQVKTHAWELDLYLGNAATESSCSFFEYCGQEKHVGDTRVRDVFEGGRSKRNDI